MLVRFDLLRTPAGSPRTCQNVNIRPELIVTLLQVRFRYLKPTVGEDHTRREPPRKRRRLVKIRESRFFFFADPLSSSARHAAYYRIIVFTVVRVPEYTHGREEYCVNRPGTSGEGLSGNGLSLFVRGPRDVVSSTFAGRTPN